MHTRELIEQQVLASPWAGAMGGYNVVKAKNLPDGDVVVILDAVYVGVRPLTFGEQVARDCVMIIRRGLRERWWGEVVPDPPTGRQILRELGVPHPPETPYAAITERMEVTVHLLRDGAMNPDAMVRGRLTAKARRDAYLDAAVLAAEGPTIYVTWVRSADYVDEYNQRPWVQCAADDLRAERAVYTLRWRVERFEEV